MHLARALLVSALAGTLAAAAQTDAGRDAGLAPREECARLEARLAGEIGAGERQAALLRLRELALAAAPPLDEVETRIVRELEGHSLPVVEPLLSRYAIVLGSSAFVEHARGANMPGTLDIAYVVLRELFAVDPVRIVGHRYVLYPEASKPHGWSIDSGNLVIQYGRTSAESGHWEDVLAHEVSHGFGNHHPARHLFANGFAEGYSDLSMAYVAERLAFLDGFAQSWESWRDGILGSGTSEYLGTRLPIEEIVGYGPAVSVVLRLCLDAGDGRPDWTPLAKLFEDELEHPLPWMPGYLWPARMAQDLQRAFPGERTWDTLSTWRFPLDASSRKAVELWQARARRTPYPTRAEQWKEDGQKVARAWRVLGPIPVPHGRSPNVDFDPLDAWNAGELRDLDLAGATYRWRDDVPVDEDGIVGLGALEGAQGPCVFYLATELPAAEDGARWLSIASDDECAVWVDGRLVHVARLARGTNPEEPDRAWTRVRRGGSRVLALVANYGGPTGFHLRSEDAEPAATAWRAELRAPSPRRRLMAVRRLGTLRADPALAIPWLADGLHDGSADVRSEAARLLAGKRGIPDVLAALVRAWGREEDPRAAAALEAAVEELALADFAGPDAAARWWRDGSDAWRASDYAEAELAYTLRSAFGGFFGNNGGAYGGQHVGRCWGGDPTHAFSLVLEARRSGPHVARLRYASAFGERRATLRVRRGEQVVFEREAIAFPATSDWTAWTWLEVPLGELAAGRYRVELSRCDGCLDFDVVGLAPAGAASGSGRR